MAECYFSASYKVLVKVYRDKAYSNLVIQEAYNHPKKNTIIKIVNGTLESHYLLSYYIKVLAEKTPQQAIRILLAQSIYCIKILQMNSSAILKLALNLAKSIGKGELTGFITYCLNKAQGDIPLPKDKKELEQIALNAPIWLISLIKKDYPKAYKRILQAQGDTRVHLRLNEYSSPDIRLRFEKDNQTAEKTLCGYFVAINDNVKGYLDRGNAFVQSLTSCYAVLAMGEVQDRQVLDMCAAPGGKSVFLAHRGAKVTACDIYKHKLQLISGYAKKAGVKLNLVLQDGTKHNAEFGNAFDCILLDAPCSGTGVVAKRQDARLNKKLKDIHALVNLQAKLLDTASAYLKQGGTLIYSTCSVLKMENEQMIQNFLKKYPNFVLQKIDSLPYNNQGMLQFLPDGKLDGFFIARMKKI